jgi:hypothetical protein
VVLMDGESLEELQRRVRRLEDESAIRKLVMSYGPAADAGMTSFAGQLWLEDGVYDWDAAGEPFQGTAGVDAMLQGDRHQGLIERGVAHFAGPPLIDVDGDGATALAYTIVMRRREGRYFLWRVSAARWDLERDAGGWRIRRRTNRLLDETGAGRVLFGDTLCELFDADSA